MISLKCPDCGFFWKQIYLTTTTSRRIDGMSEWISVKERLPEELPENTGRKTISCLVALKSCYPKGKATIQKRQRQ